MFCYFLFVYNNLLLLSNNNIKLLINIAYLRIAEKLRSAYEFNPELCIISHHTVHFPKFYQSPFLFAVLFVLVSICSFAALFEIQLKKNVVRPLDQKRGFSSTDNAHLGYSFWILLGAAGVLLLCPLMIMMKNCRCLHYFKKKKHEITTVDGVMLY